MSQRNYDYESIAVEMLTLRVNTPAGKWLSDEDVALFNQAWKEAEASEGAEGSEYLLLSMMNLAWYALTNLATVTGRSESEWLQQIVVDAHPASADTDEEER